MIKFRGRPGVLCTPSLCSGARYSLGPRCGLAFGHPFAALAQQLIPILPRIGDFTHFQPFTHFYLLRKMVILPFFAHFQPFTHFYLFRKIAESYFPKLYLLSRRIKT